MFHDLIAEHVAGHMAAVAAARERACEAALQSGECGVLETVDGTSVTFEVTHRVPYGQIHVRGL